MNSLNKLCKEILKELDNSKTINQQQLNKLKLRVIRKIKGTKIPSNIEILNNATQQQRKKYKNILTIKPTRTMSGVNVIAIMTKPRKCPHAKTGIGPCTMCPGGPKSHFGNIPQSYTGKEPATLRALRNKFDPYLQVFNRLEQYCAMNKLPEKIELIIMGGTFPYYPKKYQDTFIKDSFKAMNDFSKLFFKNNKFLVDKFLKFFELPGKVGDPKRTKNIQKKILKLKNKTKKKTKKNKISLELEQKKNEKSKIKIVGLTIETRPDYAKLKHCKQMLRLGATRVELGVQTIYNKVLKKIKRGHTVEDSIKATQTLKDLGFKINYHMMLGLPTVTPKQDLNSLKTLFTNQEFRPDMLKLYPCMVMKGTQLYKQWKKKKFKPLTTKKAIKIITKFKKNIPKFVRIMRVQRDIPTHTTEAGVDKTNLRQMIQQNLGKTKCNCIRCREPGRRNLDHKNVKFYIYEYKASDGKEFFISAEDKVNDCIVGFIRMRFPSKSFLPIITKTSALIRELHVYGETEKIGKKGKIQHRGYGKKLLKIAEQIAKQHKKNKIIIISGIGVREYYKKLGYKLQTPYMVKKV